MKKEIELAFKKYVDTKYNYNHRTYMGHIYYNYKDAANSVILGVQIPDTMEGDIKFDVKSVSIYGSNGVLQNANAIEPWSISNNVLTVKCRFPNEIFAYTTYANVDVEFYI